MDDQNETLQALAAQVQQLRDTIAQQEQLRDTMVQEQQQLRDTIAQQQAHVNALCEEMATLRQAQAATDGHTDRRAQPPRLARTSRRRLLTTAGAAAAATAAAVALGGAREAHAAPAHADTITDHQTASGSGNIAIEGDGTSGAGGVFGTSDSYAGVFGQSTSFVGVFGQSSSFIGVEGQSTSGNGVVGLSSSGDGVHATSTSGVGGSFNGGRAALNLQPAGTPGAPASGQHFAGDIYLDNTATLWLCTAFGTPGTWVEMVAVPASGTVTLQQSASGNGHTAIEGNGTSGAVGVYGTSDSAAAVRGMSSGSGAGVSGVSASGYGGVFTGGFAPLSLGLAGSLGAPSSGAHVPGEIYLDSAAVVWVCVAGGSPGTWMRLAGVASGTTGGSVNYLAAPVRLLDARSGANSGLVNRGALTANEIYALSVAGQGGSGIPAGALGLICNVTVLGPSGNGNLSLFPAGAPIPTTASMTFVAGAFLANHVSAALGSGSTNQGKVNLQNQSGGDTPLVVDAVGFIM